MMAFIKAAAQGMLTSGKLSELTPIPASFWKAVWLAGNAALGARGPIGSSNGISPNTPNGRVMEAFGTRNYPSPLLVTDGKINGPKGRLMGLKAAAFIDRIRTLAAKAVKNDDSDSVSNLLTAIRDVSFNFPQPRFPSCQEQISRERKTERENANGLYVCRASLCLTI
jgi:chitinase